MNTKHRFGIITALALALCLAAGHAHAIMQAFRVGNDTGESINVGCNSSSYNELANGSSVSVIRNETAYVELTVNSVTGYTISYDCGSNEVQGVLAKLAATAGRLDLTKGCTYS